MDANSQKVCQIIDRLREMAVREGRDDLARRLMTARDRVTEPSSRVVVVGQLKQGKSQLINSLLNIPVCRVGDAETTSMITSVGYGEEPTARLIVEDAEAGERAVPVPMDDITTDLVASPLAGGAKILRLEIKVPSPFLKQGLVLVDTPGTGGVGSPYAAATLGLLAASDAILIVSDMSQEFTAPELSFIRQAHEICPNALCLATKIDLYPSWRAVLAADVAHLTKAGIALEPKPVSSLLRAHAVRLSDPELNAESGFPALIEYLNNKVLAQAGAAMQRVVMAEVRSAAEHLSVVLQPELATLKDPEVKGRLVAELERARAEAKELSARTSMWQQTLNDGIADLSADADYDLRSRTRTMIRDYESQIDAGDPAKFWDELGENLKNDIAEAVGDNFVWVHEQSLAVAERVAESFADTTASVTIPNVDLARVGHEIAPVEGLSDMTQDPQGIVSKLVTGMRGSYGGMMMFGMMSTMIGMSMLNPFSAAAGLLLGRKTYKEDKEMRLARRRAEGKVAVRKFIDDVLFEASTESRYRLRAIQRVLRDHFRGIAEQTTRSLTESIKSIEEAARAEASTVDKRIKIIEADLKLLSEVSAWAKGGTS
ncbi:MAG: dynamin family protein [Gordonia sp. (in: high G+C Gram-positive bacteria)]